MKYDPSKIEVYYIEINGKKVPVERIPAGMTGPNGKRNIFRENKIDDEDEYEGTEDLFQRINNDPETQREFDDYINDGIEPDCDEVRSIKEEIEKEYCKELLDSYQEVTTN